MKSYQVENLRNLTYLSSSIYHTFRGFVGENCRVFFNYYFLDFVQVLIIKKSLEKRDHQVGKIIFLKVKQNFLIPLDNYLHPQHRT